MKISDALFIGVDTETTGLDPATDQLVEVALRICSFDEVPLVNSYETLCCPTIPIPATASAVHHLTDEHVVGAPEREEVRAWVRRVVDEYPDAIIFAHNAAFDRGFLPELSDRRWLCTKRFAQHLFADAPAYNNQTLRYWLGHDHLDLEGKLPHRASADIIVTEAILRSCIAEFVNARGDDLDLMLSYVDGPIFVSKIPFGKHRGSELTSVPKDYLAWCLREMKDIDPDLRWSIRRVLGIEQQGAA